MSEADRPDFTIYFNLTAGEDLAPIDVFSANQSRLLVVLVFEDSHMQRLGQLDQGARFETSVFIIALKLK